MCRKFQQELIANGWQFLRYGKGSHQLWKHPKKGLFTVSKSLSNGQVSKALRRQLFS